MNSYRVSMGGLVNVGMGSTQKPCVQPIRLS